MGEEVAALADLERMLDESAIAIPAVAADAPDSGGAVSGDVCGDCNVRLQLHGMRYECPWCSRETLVADFEEVFPTTAADICTSAPRGRLRMCGQDARSFQASLDRTSPLPANDDQFTKSIYDELTRMNRLYVDRNRNGFPPRVFRAVAKAFTAARKEGTFRADKKKRILAMLLHTNSVKDGWARTIQDCADFVGLRERSVASGRATLLRLAETDAFKSEDIDLNQDQTLPITNTVFEGLGLGGPEHQARRDAVARIIKIGQINNIGRSMLRSKVIGAAWSVLDRDPAIEISLDRVTEVCQIRANTVNKVLGEMRVRQELFEPVFESLGLGAAAESGATVEPGAAAESGATVEST